jgi:hypothetical protein
MYSGGSDEIIHPVGLPHSEIFGSKLDCSSPKRFAAYRVLHQLFAPRHPPRALRSLNKQQGYNLMAISLLKNFLLLSHVETGDWSKLQQPFPTNRVYVETLLTLTKLGSSATKLGSFAHIHLLRRMYLLRNLFVKPSHEDFTTRTRYSSRYLHTEN